MRKFLVNVLILGVLALLICFGTELLLLAVSNEYSYKRKYVEQHGGDIKVLILGHSHTGTGIDPTFLGDSVFNMAIAGRDHYYDAVLAERYIPRMKNLECVIWPLGYNLQYESYRYPCMGETKANLKGNVTYMCMYEKYMHIHPAGSSVPCRYWSEILNSNMDYSERIFHRDFEKKNKCTPLGYERYKVSSKAAGAWTRRSLPKIVDCESGNAPLALAEAMSDFKRMASVCGDNGVRFVVVSTPCYRTYRELMTERGIKDMSVCIDTMRSVNPKVEYYNYIYDDRFTEDDFFDASHLTEIGARKFTEILRNDIFSIFNTAF